MRPCRKLAHQTRSSAERHCETVRKANGQRLYPYVCWRCGKWHVGHDRLKEKAS